MLFKRCFVLVCVALVRIINSLKIIAENPELINDKHYFNESVLAIDTNVLRDVFNQRSQAPVDREDRYLNTTELIRKYGYNVEEYTVLTEDGYYLTLIRIPNYGPAVFLMHGLWGSADDFLGAGPDKALAYLLANATYDVWLGNARGNFYSKKHIRLSTESKEYWDFSWNEIGLYDLPAMIDFALSINNQPHVTYIGHGQGTTVLLVMCSSRPEYNAKIRLFIGMGTIAWVWHIKSPVLRALVPVRGQAYQLSQTLGLYELLPRSPFSLFLTSVVCSSSRLALLACSTVLFNLYGFSYGQIDYTNLPVELSHFPFGSSFKQLIHYLQLAASQTFSQFDYGEQMNLLKYNQSTPPDYPVQNCLVPVVIFYADNDWLSVLDDVQILTDQLRNVQAVHRVPHSAFNHMDFIWGKDTKQLIYNKIWDIISLDYNGGAINFNPFEFVRDTN